MAKALKTKGKSAAKAKGTKKKAGGPPVAASAPEAPAFSKWVFADEGSLGDAIRAEKARLGKVRPTTERTVYWDLQASAIDADKVAYPGPWKVLLDEAIDGARFMASHWHPQSGEGFSSERPGLFQVEARLPYATAEELVELSHLAAAAQSELLLQGLGETAKADPRATATTLVGDLLRALTFLFDDGVNDARDEALTELRTVHENADATSAALAVALESYSALGHRYRDGLVEIGFDVARLGAASDLATQLRMDSPTTHTSEAAAALRLRRDRLATLLHQRLRRVRSAAQYVFARYPKIVRQVTSAYQRQQRVERARSKGPIEAGSPKPLPE